MPNVSFCDNPGETTDESTVTFCDRSEEDETQTVTFCDDCPSTLSEMTINGDATPNVGDGFQASGGKPPYRYEISAGEINATTGVITSLSGACGTGTVSVADSCGNSASMDVRFPSGQWVQTGYTSFGTCSATYSVFTIYEGALKIRYTGSHRCYYLWLDGNGGCPYGDQPPLYLDVPLLYTRPSDYGSFCEGSPTCNGGVSYGYGTGVLVYFACNEYVYEWQCP